MTIDFIIKPQEKDLGGFSVRRILPNPKHPMVGPFIFLDHFGPVTFAPGEGIDVRPHPHIGLATVTYLFKGEILHQDNIGSYQIIKPGAVNWMTAGSGIVHSERTTQEERKNYHEVHGLQSWVALPKDQEDCPSAFHHYEAQKLPEMVSEGIKLKIIAGETYGATSPVKISSPLFYVEANLATQAEIKLPSNYTQRGIYIVSGEIITEGKSLKAGIMAAFLPNVEVKIKALEPSVFMLFGGEPFAEQRYIEWNFVSSSHQRIDQAKKDWKDGKFKKIPGDNKEFIPLPEEPKPGNFL